jgi:hypothetical protein
MVSMIYGLVLKTISRGANTNTNSGLPSTNSHRMTLRLILSLGRPKNLPDDTVAIDLKNYCFWRGSERRPREIITGRPHQYGPAPFKIMALLLMKSPNYVTLTDFIEFAFADQENGGPENIRNYIAKRIDIMRNGLRQEQSIAMWLNCQIKSHNGRGYTLIFNPVDTEARAVA